jgi:hypothetical protein
MSTSCNEPQSNPNPNPSFDAEYSSTFKYAVPRFSLPEYEPARPSSVIESGIPWAHHTLEETEENQMAFSNTPDQVRATTMTILKGPAF